ncbi:MAG: ABC transporter permease [Treponema sp.]|jgi:ribose transport system permease protein|nr:ABC transporter permease [Treponema sp.]
MRFRVSALKEIDWSRYIVYIAFVVVFLFLSIWLGGRGFLSLNNVLNITRQTSMITIMAVAMTFVIGAAQIDLSIGSIVALSSLVCALILRSTNSIILALAASVAMGALVGAVNGLLITKLGIPAFLATLGMMGIIRGIGMWITNMAAIVITNEMFNFVFGVGNIGGWFPVLLIWTVLFVVFGVILLNKTPFGKKTLAAGGNEIAARFTGINTNRVKLMTFIMSGAFAAFAGILYAGRMQAGRYTFGEGDEMSTIAAVILGGTSMSGGTGFVIGTLIGSLLMGMINNGLILGGLNVSQQTIVRGVIIILAVALSNVTRKKAV